MTMVRTKSDLNVFRKGQGGVFHVRFRFKGKRFWRSAGKYEECEARDQAWQIYSHVCGVGVGAAPAALRDCSPTLGLV